ncbi:MAG: glutamine-hydrolyzing GMP synthase [Chloroflexi bacterium]|nr:glutamine-hydrolyzing GMP synthase [Chloroflexota bacterium]
MDQNKELQASRTLEKTTETHRVATTGDLEVSTYLEIARVKVGEEPAAAPKHAPPIEKESILVLDFGSQYNMLIARRVRECQVFSALMPSDTPWEKVEPLNPKGIILSGGPASVYDPGSPMPPPWVYEKRLPVLGICYGFQAIAHQLGGRVTRGEKREYGHAVFHVNEPSSPLFKGLPPSFPVWMSHGDEIIDLPPNFQILGSTDNCPVAAIGNNQNIYGLAFHPEVAHTPLGTTILQNFIDICGCQRNWTAGNFVNETIQNIRATVGSGRVICALSGGVDSAVVATLVHRAVGEQLTCIFVNNGLLRREEAERTLEAFRRNLKMHIVYVDASDRFLNRLAGVTDPEVKRKRVGEEFINVFEDQASKLGKTDFLAQGTLYPDVIESATPATKAAAKIKTHHNVGGLPDKMSLSLVEPLRELFKDEVRAVGLALGLPEEMVWRQPFPGPGLAIRIIGEVTRERLEILRAAEWIVMNEIKKAKLYTQLWQNFAVLTDVKSVGVQGDFRTYGYLVAVRAVTSDDAMTADWAHLPYDLLGRISNRIVNEVPGVNRVVYDITSKPPSTIEWE